MIFLKNNTIRAVLEVSAINFELRSSDEQIALLQQFQSFLNAIDFEIQIVIQSRKFDIEQYLEVVQEAVTSIENDMLKVQAEEYVRFVRELSDLANIMEKKFYVVVPLEVITKATSKSITADIKGLFKKKKGADVEEKPSPEQLKAWQMQLAQRADLLSSGLAGMGLKSKLLEQDELVKLFSSLYNPEIPATKEAQ